MEGNIERLQTVFKTNGHTYRLYLRNSVVAVYSQHTNDTNQLVGYELTKIKIRPEELIGGVLYKKRECYCSTSSWGKEAFTLLANSSEEYILKKFNSFTKEITNETAGI